MSSILLTLLLAGAGDSSGRSPRWHGLIDRSGEGRCLSDRELHPGVQGCIPPLTTCEHARQECESLTYLDLKVHYHYSSISGLSDNLCRCI